MTSLLTQLVARFPRHPAHCVAVAALTATLAACSGEETGDALGGGGGAGDELDPFNTTDEELLAPFVGTYNITGSWNGVPNDEALLVIREPSDNAESDVVIYDFSSDLGNCYLVLRPGTARQERFENRIFLDGIVQFDDAELTLSGSTLVIEFFDSFDGDSDGDTAEQRIIRAPNVAQMEQDISPIC